jgi:glycosyltransferase involved in cell wall biosynthesis
MKKPRSHRILMLVENSQYPQDPRIRRESRALVAAGYQVSVIFPAGKGQPLRETVEGVRVYRYPSPRFGNGFLSYLLEYGYSVIASFLLSIEVLLREGFDVIHAANPPDALVLVAAPYKLMGKRFVYDHHDLAPEMYEARFRNGSRPLVRRALVLLERLSCRLADHVIATNESYKAVEMGRDGVAEERITIVRNGPDPELMSRAEPDPAFKPDGKKLIVFAGVMGPQDGVDYLLRALHHLVYELGRPDFFCALIGGLGGTREDLERLASDLGIEEYVRFTGWVSDRDWGSYLATADICVDPDPSNPFNDRSTMLKMMDYMTMAKPIVAFDMPEHRFTAREAALYVRPNDELEFARALAQLMDDPVRRQVMGAFGRRRVESELAWQYSVPKLLEVYDALLSGYAPGRYRAVSPEASRPASGR